MPTIEKPKMRCCCNHPDDSACAISRDSGYETDYRCECGCHQQDMDGIDDWDRYFDALKAWKESLPEIEILKEYADERDFIDGTVVNVSVNDVSHEFRVKVVAEIASA